MGECTLVSLFWALQRSINISARRGDDARWRTTPYCTKFETHLVLLKNLQDSSCTHGCLAVGKMHFGFHTVAEGLLCLLFREGEIIPPNFYKKI